MNNRYKSAAYADHTSGIKIDELTISGGQHQHPPHHQQHAPANNLDASNLQAQMAKHIIKHPSNGNSAAANAIKTNSGGSQKSVKCNASTTSVAASAIDAGPTLPPQPQQQQQHQHAPATAGQQQPHQQSHQSSSINNTNSNHSTNNKQVNNQSSSSSSSRKKNRRIGRHESRYTSGNVSLIFHWLNMLLCSSAAIHIISSIIYHPVEHSISHFIFRVPEPLFE